MFAVPVRVSLGLVGREFVGADLPRSQDAWGDPVVFDRRSWFSGIGQTALAWRQPISRSSAAKSPALAITVSTITLAALPLEVELRDPPATRCSSESPPTRPRCGLRASASMRSRSTSGWTITRPRRRFGGSTVELISAFLEQGVYVSAACAFGSGAPAEGLWLRRSGPTGRARRVRALSCARAVRLGFRRSCRVSGFVPHRFLNWPAQGRVSAPPFWQPLRRLGAEHETVCIRCHHLVRV